MSLIHGSDTKPEMLIRRLVHSMGYRYRLHVGSLPGKPDIVLPSRGKIIFVHGCFWHRHAAKHCALARMPKSRLDFWIPKLERNKERDKSNKATLARQGWKVLTIWECQINDEKRLTATIRRLTRFLDAEC